MLATIVGLVGQVGKVSFEAELDKVRLKRADLAIQNDQVP